MHASSHALAHSHSHAQADDEELGHVIRTIAAELKASTLHAQLLKAAQEEVRPIGKAMGGNV